MKDAHIFQVFADYHQFYLMDASVEPNIPEEVTEQDMLRRLRTAPNIVVFHTESARMCPSRWFSFQSQPRQKVHGSTKPSSAFRFRPERRPSAVARSTFPNALA